jgi:hypothetical protein
MPMNDDAGTTIGLGANEAAIRLATLRTEHRDLDAAIEALRQSVNLDQLRLARLKKRKLRLKDEIALLESRQVPDIIA